MKKPVSEPRAKRSRSFLLGNRLRSLHRWLGLAALCFLLMLSLTGIALNHTADLHLDRRTIDTRWLLDWYGLETVEPMSVFAVGDDFLSLVGNRLFLNAQEAARGIGELNGAVTWDGLIVAASYESLVYLSPSGEQVERIELGTDLPGSIERLGKTESALIVSSEARSYTFDERSLSVEPMNLLESPDWSVAAELSPAMIEAIAEEYRGPGITAERLLYDLHSGRLFGPVGVIAMDVVAVLLVILSVTGFWIWLRRISLVR